MRILIENIAHQPSTSPFFGGWGKRWIAAGPCSEGLQGGTGKDRPAPRSPDTSAKPWASTYPEDRSLWVFTSALYTVVDDRGVSETGTLPCLGAALHQQPTAF